MVVAVFLCLGSIFGLDYISSKYSCKAKTEQMGFPSDYSYMGGCKIEVNPGQWIPLDSYYFKQE
jgi:hypothetical protein